MSTQTEATPIRAAIITAAYNFRDTHLAGSKNLKRTAHAELEGAIDAALKLAEQPAPAQQEPIYQCQDSTGKWTDQDKHSYDYNVQHGSATVRVVYTTPQAQQPLTDEEMAKAWAVADGEHNASASVKRRITRAIEAAHNIKENQS